MLHNFMRELERQKSEMDYHQFWRYTKAGKLPRILLWLAGNPDLATALAKDAAELAKQRSGEAPRRAREGVNANA